MRGQGYRLPIDNDFGPTTERLTKDWQKKNGLTSDGIVGAKSYAKALLQGYPGVKNDDFPPVPKDLRSPSNRKREKMFGKFRWERITRFGNIRILDGWSEKNITQIHLPMLNGIEGVPSDCRIAIHRKIKDQFGEMFATYEKEGLIPKILSWAGTYVPRMVRGSRSRLSNHSWATAWDMNAPENWLGQEPARKGEKGCLYDFVPIANEFGFFWGGHYRNRKDGMHFECAKVLQ